MELPILSFATPDDLAMWMEQQPADTAGAWLKLAKKGSTRPGISYDEALTVALCLGWIDGQRKGFDDDCWLQRFTPRRVRSRWSEINRTKAIALIDAGEMRPQGQLEVDRAKADGRWEAAYAGARTMTVPDDLQAALDANPAAQSFFDTLDGTNRYAVLYRVHDAKRAATRSQRIEKFVSMLADGQKLHP